MANAMSNEIVVIGERRWLVKVANSRHDAMCAIASARSHGYSSFRLLRGLTPEIFAEVELCADSAAFRLSTTKLS